MTADQEGPDPVTIQNDTKLIDGVPYLSAEALALLVGVTVDELRTETTRQRARCAGDRFQFQMPKAWIRQAKENQARHGTSSLDRLLPLLRAEAGR